MNVSVKEKNSSNRLGRGLESMFGRSFVGGGRSVIELPINDIAPCTYQPRQIFNEEALVVLSNSIKQNGLAQPILVRPLDGGKYELIAGERRLRACKLANFKTIPAIIKQVNNLDCLKLALVENLDREDLNPLEESEGYARLIAEFNYTHQSLAELFGRSRSTISNSLRLLSLPESVKMALQKNLISEGHARTLLGVEDQETQEALLTKIMLEKLSVREVETLVAKIKYKVDDDNGQTTLLSEQETNQISGTFEKISSKFDSCGFAIKCSGSDKKGKITFKYKSYQELQDILKVLSV